MSYNRLKTETPTLVIAHRVAEYERYLMDNNLDETNSLFITSPASLDNYPIECPIARTGQYWLSPVENSRQMVARDAYWKDEAKRRESKLPEIVKIYEAALEEVALESSPYGHDEIAKKALEEVKKIREGV